MLAAKAHRHANGTGGLGGDRSRMFSQVELASVFHADSEQAVAALI
jgi:hypothetical protein